MGRNEKVEQHISKKEDPQT